MADDTSPLDRLRTLGESTLREAAWLDYPGLGLGPEHVPDLIRLATARALDEVTDWDTPEPWAPVHAWRALGQLRAEAAVGPLLEQLQWAEENDDDWGYEDIPAVLGLIGRAAIPAVEAFVADPSRTESARIFASRVLEEVPTHDPDARGDCVAALTRALERAEQNEPALNGFLISDLLGLKAVESATVIERAFEGGHVDESIAGDWEEVRYDLGLGPMPERRARRLSNPFQGWGPPALGPIDEGDKKQSGAQRKARRKQAKKSRKQNRKRR